MSMSEISGETSLEEKAFGYDLSKKPREVKIIYSKLLVREKTERKAENGKWSKHTPLSVEEKKILLTIAERSVELGVDPIKMREEYKNNPNPPSIRSQPLGDRD